jgi:hypothetical protein
MRTESFQLSRTVLACALALGATFLHAACAPASAAPPEAPAGAQAASDTYEVALVPPAAAKPGAAATARVVVKAKGPYHVNREYPMAFRPDAAASTVAFDGAKVALNQAGAEKTACKDHPGEACAVSSPLPFTAKAAGDATLAGTVAFSVCNPERCLIEKVPLKATVAVK